MTHKTNLTIGASTAEQRVDWALSRLLPGASRREIQKLCESGNVRRGGRPLRKSDLLHLGDQVEIARRLSVATPNPEGRLVVRYESKHWVVVSKPALQPTAPKDDSELDALANALVAAYPEMQGIGHAALEPGLLHRLDNGTSGLLVAARSAVGFHAATLALKRGQWEKRYLAVVNGCNLPQSGLIHGRLMASRRHPARVVVPDGVTVEAKADAPRMLAPTHPDQDRPARAFVTRFKLLECAERLSLVDVVVGAAFRHQIRAHFAAAGWPLVNDEVYGATANRQLEPERHALHAARVAWSGTTDLAGFDVTEALAEDLAALVRLSGGVTA